MVDITGKIYDDIVDLQEKTRRLFKYTECDRTDLVSMKHDLTKNISNVKRLFIDKEKCAEGLRTCQDDINQLYLLFNELLRSNKKEKDDG